MRVGNHQSGGSPLSGEESQDPRTVVGTPFLFVTPAAPAQAPPQLSRRVQVGHGEGSAAHLSWPCPAGLGLGPGEVRGARFWGSLVVKCIEDLT